MRKVMSITAVAAAAALALTGCSSIGDAVNDKIGDAIGDGIENVVENQLGADINIGGSLPFNFPSEVPVPNGDITFSLGSEDGYIVYFTVDGEGEIDRYREALEAAGYALESEMDQVGLSIFVYVGNGYNLNVAYLTEENTSTSSIQLIVGPSDQQ